MNIEREPFSPCKESLLSVESCVSEISPDDPRLNNWHRSFVEGAKTRVAFDFDIIRNNLALDSNLLEFGSIPPLLTAVLVKNGYKVSGCDIRPERYHSSINKLNIRVVKCDIEKELLPFEKDTFDGIIFNEVFEHLRINLIFTLNEVFRIMKPGAIMLLSTPNLRSFRGIMNFILRNRSYSCSENIYDQYKQLETLGHMGHVREYTTKEVIEFLENIGFEVTKLIFRGGHNTTTKQILSSIFPKLSPSVSFVVKKNALYEINA